MARKFIRNTGYAALAMLAWSAAWATGTLDYPGLGKVTIEQPRGTPQHVVIFLFGDGVDVTQMGRQARDSHATCVGAAGMLEGLSHYVQQKYGMQHYEKPVLVGYSSGATLAYATLAQAPPGTFKGAVSLGFCPDLEWSKPLCRGEGLEHEAAPKSGFIYRPAPHLQDPWIALQGEED